MGHREVDRWRAGSALHPLIYRVMEDEDTRIRHLEVKSRFDEDFRKPERSHATELATRLMELFEREDKIIGRIEGGAERERTQAVG